MDTKKRMAGSYEIIQALHIGDKEVVLGEDELNKDGQKFMTAYCTTNDFFASYEDVWVSDNYAEIVKYYGERVAEEAEKMKTEIEQLDVPHAVITAEQCYPNDYAESIDGKVIAIKVSVLRPEYQRADRQIFLVDGGFGASANSRGSAVFCYNVHTGKHTRWERRDVEGVIKDEAMPAWAKEKLKTLMVEHKKTQKDKEER